MDQKTTTNPTKARNALRKQLGLHYANLAAVQQTLDEGVREHWVVNPGEPDEYVEFSEERRPMTDDERHTAEWTVERLRKQILELGQQLFGANTLPLDPPHQESVAA